MKKMLARIVPHIIPELKLLFMKMLPLAILISVVFIFGTDAQFQIRNEINVVLYGILFSLVGLYLVRITAYVIKRIITNIHQVMPDYIYNENNNSNSKAA